MRILHVIDSMNPSQGGPPSAVAGLAAAQAGLGNHVSIYSQGSGETADVIEKSMHGMPGADDVALLYCAPRNRVDRLLAMTASNQLRSIVNSIDIVHIHGLWQPILSAAANIGKENGLKYVITPHGMLTPWSLAQKRYKKQAALVFSWKKILQEASFIHMLSKEEEHESQVSGVTTPVEIMPNGIFDKKDNKKIIRAMPSFSECNITTGKPYILFIGRLHYVKGLDYLVNAFRQIAVFEKNIDLVIAGPDFGEKDKLLRLVEKYALGDRIHFIGAVYGEEKYQLFADALCLCQPSRQEGFSMTITEAMSMGLPVVITRTCRFPGVEEAGAGEVVDLDADGISEALLKIIRDSDWRERAGRAARELVLENYTWPRIAEKSIGAYTRVLSEDTKLSAQANGKH